jgi:hypothetical protein
MTWALAHRCDTRTFGGLAINNSPASLPTHLENRKFRAQNGRKVAQSRQFRAPKRFPQWRRDYGIGAEIGAVPFAA